MIVLEEPYLSRALLLYLEQSQTPVLANECALTIVAEYPGLNITTEHVFVDRIRTLSNPRLYTVSEYALDWFFKTQPSEHLLNDIALLKNKYAFRKACASMYRDFFYEEIALSALSDVSVDTLPLPVVLKPAVGFLSAGVYTIRCADDWMRALEDIDANFVAHAATFPDKVVEHSSFIVESYIGGREFAIDLYFKDYQPVIVNIFEHLFASETDVSDRLYVTSKALFDQYLADFTAFAQQLNEYLGIENMPVHLELRIDRSAIVPIEINPLRFTGLCLNELHCHIAGAHPLSYYFSQTVPDYQSMWQGKEDKTYSFAIFDKSPGGNSSTAYLEKIKSLFGSILEFRPVDNPNLNIAAFVFSESPSGDTAEQKRILHFDTQLQF